MQWLRCLLLLTCVSQPSLCRREEHKQTGQMCEHGVWRCRICFPHETK